MAILLRRGFIPDTSSLEPETVAWIAAVGGAGVTTAQQTNVNNLVVGLKQDFGLALGSLTLKNAFDRIWLHAAENVTQASIDIVNAQSLSNTGGGGLTYGSTGFTGSGTTFANTNFTPSTNGVAYLTDNSSYAQYVFNNRTSTATVATLGSYDGSTGGLQVLPLLNGAGDQWAIDAGGTAQTLTATARGFHVVTRTGATACAEYLYRVPGDGGNTSQSSSNGFGNLPSFPVFIMARNNQNTADLIASDTVACTVFGEGLDSTHAGFLATRMNTYMTSAPISIAGFQ
jgi:hypothetical protein